MAKRWRESIKALGSYIDPEQDEQVKRAKIGMHFYSKLQPHHQSSSLQYCWRPWDHCPIETKRTRCQCHPKSRALPQCVGTVFVIPGRELDDRVATLMKLIQHKSRSKKSGGPIFDSELIELIDDFHKKYQSLYSLYEDLKGQLMPNDVYDKENKENSSSSDSESHYSSQHLDLVPRVKNEHNLELKDGLHLERDAVLRKIEESEKVIKELRHCLNEKEREVKELVDENEGLRELVFELEMTSKEREEKLSDLLIKIEENEADLMVKSEDLIEKANDLQLEVLDALWSEKEIVWKEGEIMNMLSPHKSKSESSLLKVNEEASGFMFYVESLKAKFERKNIDMQRILEEKKGIERKVKMLENEMRSKILEEAKLRMENEELHVGISQLEELLMEKNHEICVVETDFEGLKNDSCSEIKALEGEIMILRRENKEFTNSLSEMEEQNMDLLISKIEDHEETLKESTGTITTNVELDKLKNISMVSDEIFNVLKEVEMKFQDCDTKFLNRISTCSSEVKFAKNWAKRKNEAMHRMEGNLDILFGEVESKEDDIMRLKERIWKLENEVRDKEEGMLGLGEEKREAIRQLCVWVDYHMTQNNNLKKILSDLPTSRGPRAS